MYNKFYIRIILIIFTLNLEEQLNIGVSLNICLEDFIYIRCMIIFVNIIAFSVHSLCVSHVTQNKSSSIHIYIFLPEFMLV